MAWVSVACCQLPVLHSSSVTTTPAAPAISSSTPILDRVLPAPLPVEGSPQTQRDIKIILWIVGLSMGVGLFVLFQITSGLDASGDPGGQLVQFIRRAIGLLFPQDLSGYEMLLPAFFSAIAFFAAVTVHELGHLLAGRWSHFRLVSIQLGHVQITPPFHIRWRPRALVPGASGLVIMAPLDARSLRIRAIIMLLGGCAANLITGLSFTFLWPSHALLSRWFIVMSVVLGLVNLLPFRSKALLSDGKRILMLLRNSRQGQRWLALLRLNADIGRGIDPEKLNPQIMAIATAVEDESPDTVNAHILAFAAAFAKHDDPEAARLLEVCLRHSGSAWPAQREAAFLNAAIFQAERRRCADLAEQWLADLPEKSSFPQNRLNAQGAILQSRGDIAGALKKLDESEAMVLRMAPSPKKEAALGALQKWRAELLEQADPKKKAESSV